MPVLSRLRWHGVCMWSRFENVILVRCGHGRLITPNLPTKYKLHPYFDQLHNFPQRLLFDNNCVRILNSTLERLAQRQTTPSAQNSLNECIPVNGVNRGISHTNNVWPAPFILFCHITNSKSKCRAATLYILWCVWRALYIFTARRHRHSPLIFHFFISCLLFLWLAVNRRGSEISAQKIEIQFYLFIYCVRASVLLCVVPSSITSLSFVLYGRKNQQHHIILLNYINWKMRRSTQIRWAEA